MTAPNLQAIEIKTFLPSRDFALSKRFYEAIGFEIPWSSEDTAEVRYGACGFLLQDVYNKASAENLMLHLLVENVDDWHRHLQEKRIAEEFGVKLSAPEDQPWGLRDFTLFDPSGVLWRVAQEPDAKPVQ